MALLIEQILHLLFIHQCFSLQTSRLHDGLIIHQTKSIKLQKAEWTLLITISPPNLQDLYPYLNSVRNMVSEFKDDTNEQIKTLQYRIQYLVNAHSQLTKVLTSSHETTRVKRGLLNFGGTILQHLFGVATEEDINKYRTTVRRALQNEERITHSYREMASVINDIQNTIVENQRTIESWYNHISEYMDNFTVSVSNRQYANKRHILLNDLLDLITSYHEQNTEHLGYYLKQRSDLELGMLTEHILPRTDLENFLTKIQSKYFQHLQSLKWTWYYQNLQIQPIWQQGDTLVFITKIPFMSPDNYLLYHLYSYPVNANETLVQLKPEPIIAADPQSNGLFIPQNCRGIQPSVCTTTQIGYAPLYNCERGLLLQQTLSIDSCPISVNKLQTTPIAYQALIGTGQFVLITSDHDDITLHCPNQPAESLSLSTGTHLIKIPDHCGLTSELWTLTTWIHGSSSINYTSPKITLPSLSLFNLSLQPKLTELEHFHVNKLLTLHELKKINLTAPKVDLDDTDEDMLYAVKEHSHKLLIGLYILIPLTIIGVIIYYCKYKRLLCFNYTIPLQVHYDKTSDSVRTLNLTRSCTELYPSVTSLSTSTNTTNTSSVTNATNQILSANQMKLNTMNHDSLFGKIPSKVDCQAPTVSLDNETKNSI